MKTYTVKDFTNLTKFIWNRSAIEFATMYKTLGFIGEGYILEKFEKSRNNFIYWWCELDEDNQEKIIEYVKEFYDK